MEGTWFPKKNDKREGGNGGTVSRNMTLNKDHA
jgi:hypothetical protein